MFEHELKNAYIGEYNIPTLGLLGYRPLQSDLKDYSGNGKDGSWYSGTGTFSANAGKTGARVTRTSNYLASQYVVTPLTYEQAPITIGGWICFNVSPSAYGHWEGLMSTSNGAGKGWTTGTRPADSYYPQIGLGSTYCRITAAVPSTNTWYFWVGTREGTTVKAYLNGVLVNTVTTADGTAGGVRRLGCAMIDSGQSVNSGTDGRIRHCAVYNRALTADEIMKFYTLTA